LRLFGNKVVAFCGDFGHDEHEEDALKFSSSELQEFNIKLAQAHAGVINKTLDLTGEVIVAPERLYHVVPRVAGVVREVYKYLGDHKAGK
jgi:cobalt-zinc-cadmium efflux system membrane fusion protein